MTGRKVSVYYFGILVERVNEIIASKLIACSSSTWYSTLYHYPKNGGKELHFHDFNVHNLHNLPEKGAERKEEIHKRFSQNLSRKIVFGILRTHVIIILWNNYKCERKRGTLRWKALKDFLSVSTNHRFPQKGQLRLANCRPFCQEPPVYNNRRN